jgi:hypothetical protein
VPLFKGGLRCRIFGFSTLIEHGKTGSACCSVAEMALGLWLIASPYIFGYSGDGMLRFYHSSLGGVVVLLAALQLWQDWDLSDQEMLKHGQ